MVKRTFTIAGRNQRMSNVNLIVTDISDTVIADTDQIAFQPYVGDVLLFNTSKFYYVEPMNGQRVGFTSMIGLLPNGEIIFWS
jgi:hypothetical protein